MNAFWVKYPSKYWNNTIELETKNGIECPQILLLKISTENSFAIHSRIPINVEFLEISKWKFLNILSLV